MEGMIGRLLDASLQGMAGYVAVLAIVNIFHRLSPSAKCWLWRLCGLKLLVSMAFILSLPVLPSSGEGIFDASNDLVPTTSVVTLDTSAPQQNLNFGQPDWPMLLAATWLVIALILALRQWSRYALERRRLITTTRPTPLNFNGLKASNRILVSEKARSPMVVGLFHPIILLPKSLMSRPEQLEMAILHEQAHIRRRDLVWQALLAIVGCCFWFLPPARWIERLARTEAEQACDLEVVTATGNPRTYFRFLVQLAQCRQVAPGIACMVSETRRVLARRINTVKQTRIQWQFALLALALAAPALLPLRAVGQMANSPSPSPTIDSLAKKHMGVFELDLSPEQRLRFKELSERHNKETREFGNKLAAMKQANVSDKDRIAYDISIRMPMFNRQTEERWNVLTEAQKQRQRQVTLQYLGPMSIGNKEVAKSVGVSEAKRLRIKALADQYRIFMSEQEHANWTEGRDLMSKKVKIRDYTVAEQERMELLRKEIYTAFGERRSKLKKELAEIQRRGIRYEVNQDLFIGKSKSFNEARSLAIKRLMDERRREYYRLSAIAESHLTLHQRSAWSKMLGTRVEFPKREANGDWVIAYR
jgi:beta-lactamase regulating signal transducer with metallopeptidase domain